MCGNIVIQISILGLHGQLCRQYLNFLLCHRIESDIMTQANAQPRPENVVWKKPVIPSDPPDSAPPKLGHPIYSGANQPHFDFQESAPPTAQNAYMKKRHWGLLTSFLITVIAPLAIVVFYLWNMALDQYSSKTGFAVRQEESTGASDFLGGLAQFAGASTSADSDILYEFIQSQKMVQSIDDSVDLVGHYSTHWKTDPVFAIWPTASIEDLVSYWQRIVRISYDKSTGLIEVRIVAYSGDMAQRIGKQILHQSQDLINSLNLQARDDAMRYAQADLDTALGRLKTTRQDLTKFRTRTQIVDPSMDMQGRMGVIINLQQELAEVLVSHDLLLTTASTADPRVVQAKRKIDVVRDRIERERSAFASGTTETGELGEDYPSLIAEFEDLTVEQEFAEQTYLASLAALDLAKTRASRQSRYLATYIPSTRAQNAEYPKRFVLSGLTGLFLILSWSIMALIYYSIRDRG